MRREFFFDDLTARDVAERLRVRAEVEAYLNAVALTVARMNGAGNNERVMLNGSGTGIIVVSSADNVDDAIPEAAAMDGKRK